MPNIYGQLEAIERALASGAEEVIVPHSVLRRAYNRAPQGLRPRLRGHPNADETSVLMPAKVATLLLQHVQLKRKVNLAAFLAEFHRNKR